MKRIGNVYQQICDLENLQLADMKARKGKKRQKAIRRHDLKRDANLLALQGMLVNKTYKTSPYYTFKVYEPKEREVYRAEYYPDRIAHHAILNVIEPHFSAVFTADTYSSIKRRGIQGMARKIRRALNDRQGTQYFLKLDIKKFYPSIDHDILKQLLRRKFKDKDLLWVLDEIIDSAPGLPIGNYLSQYFANFYLTYFDHWLKEELKVKYYFRYADDIVIMADSKAFLHMLRGMITTYLLNKLKLEVKGNYRVAPLDAQGLDVIGYVFYHTHTLIRKRTKRRYARMLKRRPNQLSIAAYNGMLSHCNSHNLKRKLLNHMKSFKDLQIQQERKGFEGTKLEMDMIINRQIVVHDYKLADSKHYAGEKCLHMQIEVNGNRHVVFSRSKILQADIQKVDRADFPFTTTIVRENKRLDFT